MKPLDVAEILRSVGLRACPDCGSWFVRTRLALHFHAQRCTGEQAFVPAVQS